MTASDHVEIVAITSPAECEQLARVLADVWGLAELTGVVAPDTLRAMAHSGAYVVGVRAGGQLLGGGFGWPAYVDGEWRLHSHVVGFLDGHRGVGLGARVKHHQRQFARLNGFAAIEWTYDPLHAANAWFNLGKLGARVVGFHRDFYGEVDDAFNAGFGSDRFTVRWGVDDEPQPDDGATTRDAILARGAGRDGGDCDDRREPVVRVTASRRVRAQIPANIVGMRASNPPLAIAWREAFASTVGAEIESGATVVGISADRCYLIDRPR